MQHTQSNKNPPKTVPLDVIFFCYLHTQKEFFKMSKTSVRNSDDTKTVFSEPSPGSYVTANYEVALTKYLVHLPSQNYSIVDIDVKDDEYFTRYHQLNLMRSNESINEYIQKFINLLMKNMYQPEYLLTTRLFAKKNCFRTVYC